jgi:hypothetical protein
MALNREYPNILCQSFVYKINDKFTEISQMQKNVCQLNNLFEQNLGKEFQSFDGLYISYFLCIFYE